MDQSRMQMSVLLARAKNSSVSLWLESLTDIVYIAFTDGPWSRCIVEQLLL